MPTAKTESPAQPIGRAVPIDKIQMHPDLQARVRMDENKVKEFTGYFKEGREIDPIHVFTSATNNVPQYLADGAHRYIGAINAEEKKIFAIVHEVEGDEAEILKQALYFGIEKNAGHGLAFTNEDKNRAVALALKVDRSKSDKFIARLCRVSAALVKKVREHGVREKKTKTPREPKPKTSPETVQTMPPVSTAPEPGSAAEAASHGDIMQERARTLRDWKRDGFDFPEVRDIFATRDMIPQMVPKEPTYIKIELCGDDGEILGSVNAPILSFSVKGGVLSMKAYKQPFLDSLG